MAGEEGAQRVSHHDVAPSMKCQVVRAGEAAIAVSAAKRFNAGVLAKVPRQLVRAGKAPGTALPCALVWLFTCKVITVSINMIYTNAYHLFNRKCRIYIYIIFYIKIFLYFFILK